MDLAWTSRGPAASRHVPGADLPFTWDGPGVYLACTWPGPRPAARPGPAAGHRAGPG